MPVRNEYDSRIERTTGMVFDVDLHAMVPYDHVDDEFLVNTLHATKAPVYHGDHHTAYDWGSGENKILSDVPVVLHHYYDNPIDHLTSNYDLLQISYLSKIRVPFSSSPIVGVRVENAQSEAITQAINSLKGVSANWGSDLGEMRQSVDSIADSAKRAANFIRFMKRGQWSRAATALGLSRGSFSGNHNRGRALANYWLSYAYGWRPLAKTMYDTQLTIADIVNRNNSNVEGNGSGSVNGSGSGTYFGRTLETNSWYGGCKCTLKATIGNYNLLNLNKVGLTNPASIAWELVPFSFVVDWFLPIGNVLEALTGSQGLDFHGGWFSTITRATVNLYQETGVQTPWTTCESGGDYSEEQFTFSRVALTAFPLPRLYADLTPFSTPRAVNALALVRQLT